MSPWQFGDRRIIKLNFQAYNGLIFNANHLISHDKRRSSLACGVIGCLRRHIGRDASLVVNLCFQWHGVVSEFSVRHCFVKSLCCLPHGNGACLVIHSSGNLSCRSTFYHHGISRCFSTLTAVLGENLHFMLTDQWVAAIEHFFVHIVGSFICLVLGVLTVRGHF